jgi:type II secretory pathway pseudopilin PulG
MKHQSGNALVIVLVAVALLAALTMMMTRSGSSTDDTGDIERAQIYASEVMRFGKTLQNGAQTLITRGCSESTLNFDYSSAVTGYENASAPGDGSCDLFGEKGAGLVWRTPPAGLTASAYVITAANTMLGAGCDTGSATCTDLVLFVPGVSVDACTQINRMLKVTNPADIPPADSDNLVDTATKFTGSYTFVRAVADAGSLISGKDAACIQTSAGNYAFYSVILKR